MSTQTLLSRSVSAGLDTRQCREWLQAAGLRFSMPRLKVVEALCSANDEEGVSARELHRQLSDAGEPLSLVSVRQVLRRMEETVWCRRRGVAATALARRINARVAVLLPGRAALAGLAPCECPPTATGGSAVHRGSPGPAPAHGG